MLVSPLLQMKVHGEREREKKKEGKMIKFGLVVLWLINLVRSVVLDV